MAIEDSFSRVQYTAILGQTQFDGPSNAKIFEITDVKVYLTPLGQSPNESVDILSLDIDYTVVFDNVSFYITLIVPAAAGDTVTVERSIPYNRKDDYQTEGTFTGNRMDLNLDRITGQIEQIRSDLYLTGLLYDTTTEGLTEGFLRFPKLGPLQLLRANASGSGLEAVTFDENPDWSTLRSELENDQEFTDGARIVGYFNTVLSGSTTVHDALDYILDKDHNGPPFSSALDIIKDSTDDTKLLKFDVSNIATGTTRTISMPDNNVSLANSTETSSGLIEIATQSEVDDGTDNTKAVTPLKLKNYIEDNYIMVTALANTTKTGVIISSINLSVSKTGEGIYEYSFIEPLDNINYVVICNNNDSFIPTIIVLNKTTSGFKVETYASGTGYITDHSHKVRVYSK
ncbi:MAG: hypothetical protein ACTSR1_00225 [Candidatus Heimdallarchaeota archaeon]